MQRSTGFPAQPLPGPIYVPVDHFMPTDFPPLLIVPAFALDLVLQPARGRINDRVLALLASAVFLVTFLAVEYPFANFLMTWRSAALTNYTVFV